MKIKEAIILAGGLGTRLRQTIPDLPKCMAPVAGRPFISHVIDYFRQQGIERFIYSLGYRHEPIQHFITQHYPETSYRFSIEEDPLGTGGAIKLACSGSETDNLLVLNGDTLYRVSLASLTTHHFTKAADCTLALKPMRDFDRYGSVETDNSDRIKVFKEKQWVREGLINGGVYLINKTAFLNRSFPARFSFEKDYLEEAVKEPEHRIYGQIQDGYFIDIGVPEDFRRAGMEIQQLTEH